jgi:O-antigen/teichoic acid export membrane protein
MEKYIRDAVKNSYFVLALSAAGIFVGYMLRIFLSRTLSMEDFGLFYAVSAFMGIFILFRYLGLNQALTKYIPEFVIRGEKNKIKTSVSVVAAVQISATLCFTAFILIFQEPIAISIFGSGKATQLLVLMTLSFIPSTFFVIFQSVFQGYQKIRLYAMVDPLRIFLTFIFSILFIPMGVVGIAAAYLVAATATTLFFLPSFHGLGIAKARLEGAGEIFSKMMKFGAPVLFGSVGFVLINNIDTTILTLFRPLSEVALYQVALPTSQLLLIFSSSLTIVVLPLVSELYTRKKFDEIGRGITVITTLLVLAIAPFVIAAIAFPDAIIRLLWPRPMR